MCLEILYYLEIPFLIANSGPSSSESVCWKGVNKALPMLSWPASPGWTKHMAH